MKKLPPKVKVEVIKKGPPADTLTGALFGTMETETMDEYKGKFDCSLGNLLCVVDTIPTKNGRELVEKWVSELMTNF